jgi:cell division protein FtsB
MAAKRGVGPAAGKTGGAARRAAPGGPLTTKQIIGRVVLASSALAVVAFAVQGGEYGTTDLIRQRNLLARERRIVDSLAAEVERLKVYKKSVETDPVMQEKLAREEFGMVKGDREILYRFLEK